MHLISFKNLGAGITLTKSEIKDIKILWSLENRGILLKGTTRKITSQEGGFKNFFRQLRTAGLPLIKNVLTPIMKNVTIWIISRNVSSRCSYSKTIDGSGTTVLIIPNEEMIRYNENSSITWGDRIITKSN